VVIDPTIEGTPNRPFDELLGIEIVELSADRVVAELPVTPALHQPYGILHGGAIAALAETAASYGGALAAAESGGGAVGVSNHTDFLSAVRDGKLRAEATPLARGRSFQLWQVAMTRGDGRLVAHAKVRLFNLPGAAEPA
jgi:1,4-dihydroxy-2-naphthoyl-CoA hydrolase